jgi:hypothetical protein
MPTQKASISSQPSAGELLLAHPRALADDLAVDECRRGAPAAEREVSLRDQNLMTLNVSASVFGKRRRKLSQL